MVQLELDITCVCTGFPPHRQDLSSSAAAFQAEKQYPYQHKLPAKSLEALGLEVPKPGELVVQSMASNLPQYPRELLPAGLAGGMLQEHRNGDAAGAAAHDSDRTHQNGEGFQGLASRLHEILTPSQAQALGERDLSQ